MFTRDYVLEAGESRLGIAKSRGISDVRINGHALKRGDSKSPGAHISRRGAPVAYSYPDGCTLIFYPTPARAYTVEIDARFDGGDPFPAEWREMYNAAYAALPKKRKRNHI